MRWRIGASLSWSNWEGPGRKAVMLWRSCLLSSVQCWRLTSSAMGPVLRGDTLLSLARNKDNTFAAL